VIHSFSITKLKINAVDGKSLDAPGAEGGKILMRRKAFLKAGGQERRNVTRVREAARGR
jgi:hypothetical protein